MMQRDRQRINPLPLRVRPLPWEDLHSFLARTAKRMQYEKATQVIQPEMGDHHIASSQVSLLTEQSDYTFLSDLLRIPEEALYQMTLHRFWTPFEHLDFFPVLKDPYKCDLYLQPRTTPYRSPIQRPRLEIGLLSNFFLPNQITQICPLCLQEGIAYDRLYWKARYLLTCQKHAVLLLRLCPTCQKPIPSSRLEPTSCPFCHRAYHSSSSMPVPLPSEAACLLHGDFLTLRALGVTPLPTHPSISASKSDPRESLPPEQYFALVRATCISLHPLQVPDFQTFLTPAFYDFLVQSKITHRPYPDHVPPLQVAATHWIFAAWPDHFFTYLDALQQWSRHARKKHAFYNFPYRFLLGSRAKEAHAFLSQAYRLYTTTPPQSRQTPLQCPAALSTSTSP
jgi:hypothetical protein